MHAITKRLEICIDINIEIRKVDYYSWIFTSRIFRLVFFLTNGLRVTLTKRKT